MNELQVSGCWLLVGIYNIERLSYLLFNYSNNLLNLAIFVSFNCFNGFLITSLTLHYDLCLSSGQFGQANSVNQRYEILKYADSKKLSIDQWIEETVSSTKKVDQRKLGPPLNAMQSADLLIVSELSRLGRNLIEADAAR